MTRETKIGLLVGLAFIIVIGILLSDHLSSSAEPPAATLVQAGTNVRQQVATPAGSQPQVQPFTTPAIVVQSNPIATQRDLTPPTDPSVAIKIGPPVTSTTPTNKPNENAAEPPVTFPQNTVAQNDPKLGENGQTELSNNDSTDLGKLAAQRGEQLISPNGQPMSPLPMPKPVAANGKDYVIQSGDTISKLATRFLGSNTKANRDLIIKANPSLAANPDKLVVGKSYKMPSAPNAASASAAPTAPTPVSTDAPVAKSAPVELASSSETYYTVESGDSLWRIASSQLGKGGSGVAAIKELNKDTLNGGDTVTVGMKLRMPGKLLASVN